jgi:hypothetical protein
VDSDFGGSPGARLPERLCSFLSFLSFRFFLRDAGWIFGRSTFCSQILTLYRPSTLELRSPNRYS